MSSRSASPPQDDEPGLVQIDLVIVGAAKSATTSLHRYLAQHPGIFMPEVKELGFFLAEPGDPVELDLLRTYYADVRPGQLVGLSEVHQLMRCSTAERIRQHNPRARAIAILRDPIERAYSSYWVARLKGWDPSPTFEHAIDRELEGRLETETDRLILSHIEHGRYADQLDHYHAVLGPQQVAILLTEDLRADPTGTLRNLLSWLGLDTKSTGPEPLSSIRTDVRHNVTTRSRLHRLEHALTPLTGPLRSIARHIIPRPVRQHTRQRVMIPLRRLTHAPFKRPPMSPATRGRLRTYYRPQVERLATMLDRDLGHWLDDPG